MNAPLPADPMSALREAMASLHEIYLSAIDSGFTDGEAMRFVIGVAIGLQQQGGDR